MLSPLSINICKLYGEIKTGIELTATQLLCSSILRKWEILKEVLRSEQNAVQKRNEKERDK